MANILCIYENKIATVAGVELFFDDLMKYESRITARFVPIRKLKKEDLNWCDILYMIRPNNRVFARIARFSKKYGVFVVFFLDDDLLHLPEGHADMSWRKKGLSAAARESDVIVSSSRRICKNYSKWFGVDRMVSMDTPVPSNSIKNHFKDKNERIKIVYAAGVGHISLFDRFIRPILGELDQRVGDIISLTFMGVHPEIDVTKYRMPINYIDGLPLNEYRLKIEEENFDIGLAPLVTSDFSKCKYFNKFIEYAMFGIVGLYSDTEPYTLVIKDRENGLLVKDDPREWLEAVCHAVRDEGLIDRCRTNAYKLLRDAFDSQKIMDGFLSSIPEMIEPHRGKGIKAYELMVYKAQYRISRLGDWIYKTRYYYKRGGFREVMKGIRRIIKTSKLVRS